jgi:ribosomal protein S18 acetylase RimI-like enzyme
LTQRPCLRLGPQDWERFRRVRLASLAESPHAFGSQSDEVAQRPQSSWTGQLGVLPTWVIPGEDQDIGVVRVDPGVPELISLWVAPEGRGKGLGKQLIHQVMAWAQESGHVSLELCVKTENLPAVGLYRALGFEELGLEADEVRMRAAISG